MIKFLIFSPCQWGRNFVVAEELICFGVSGLSFFLILQDSTIPEYFGTSGCDVLQCK
jgi:hypothetical protein